MVQNKLSNDYGITFDDVLLKPRYTDVLPSDVDTTTRLTSNIKLKSPIIASPMDSVTESNMAIALAKYGGVGVIHRNMSIDDQVEQVRLVKRYQSGMITDPVTVSQDITVGRVKELYDTYRISGLPVVADNNILIGLITQRDVIFERDDNKLVSEVMTRMPLVCAYDTVSDDEAYNLLCKHKKEKLPLVNKDNQLTGLISLKDFIQKQKYPNASIDEHGRLLVGAAVGTDETYLERIEKLDDIGADFIVFDTAHGDAKIVLDAISLVRKRFKNIDIIGGNVATLEGCRMLLDVGVNSVRVGIGPGSICTTRVISGVGIPQITAILDVYKIAFKYNVPIISDGGIRYVGDIVKAIAAGADTVMLGNMLAGVDESPGELIFTNGKHYKKYRGMGSLSAMLKRKDGKGGYSKDRYFHNVNNKNNIENTLVPEGVEGIVSYCGPLQKLHQELISGLRVGMGYCGAHNIKDLHKNTEFIRITQASLRESYPHDLTYSYNNDEKDIFFRDIN